MRQRTYEVAFFLVVLALCQCISAKTSAQKTVTIWTAFGGNDTMGLLLKNKDSFTHISVLGYMIDINGNFACSCDPSVPWQRPCNNNGSWADCPWWDSHIAQLQANGILVAPTITLPPGYDGTGLVKLLNSTALQDALIKYATLLAVERQYTGYNVDWEAGVGTSEQIAALMARLKASLNTVGKTLSIDTFTIYDPTVLRPGVDVLMDMSVYGMEGELLRSMLQLNIATAGSVYHYGMGMLANMPDASLQDELDAAEEVGVVNVYIWPDEPIDTISPNLWVYTRNWLQSP